METPAETIFNMEIVDIHTGNWIDLQNRGGYNVPMRHGTRSKLIYLLSRNAVGSHLYIMNRAFVGVVRRAPII